LAAKITADLHRWLFDEYLGPQLERGTERELPREEIQALLESIQDLSALNQDLLRRLQAAGYIFTSPLHSLLTSEEFLARAEHAALTSHQGTLIGRKAALAEVKAHLLGSTCVIVLHGPGGIGKTRLLLALPDVVPEGTSLRYVRTEAESIEGAVAYIRPDDTLRIVAHVVDGPEQPPETHHDSWLGPLEITHVMVLDHAVQLLGHSIDHGNLRDVVSYLYKLARYRPEAQEYIRIRDKAHEALVKIAEFKPHKPYEVQLTLLEMIRVWLEQDFGGNLDLCLALIQPMLRMEFQSAEADPTKPFAIAFQQGLLRPNEHW
jgi:hypothetical protein